MEGQRVILSRYVMKQIVVAWASIAAVLLIVMVASRFASVLNFAAKGDVPKDLLLNVVLLSSLRYLVILMPVSLLLAIMLALGRMYSENEMAAMFGCGVALGTLYRAVLLLAVAVGALTAWLAFGVGPWAGQRADYLVKDSRHLLQFSPFEPGKFQTFAGGQAVFYTSALDDDGRRLGHVFVQSQRADGQLNTVVADHGEQQIDAQTGERLVVLYDGVRYLGANGQADYDVTHFRQLSLRIAPPPFRYVVSQRQLQPTRALLHSRDPADQAELQARIALPISVLILALLAVPLSHLRPRQGRYSKIVAGVVVYLVYANLVGVAQAWIAHGKLPAVPGLWWIHAAVLGVAMILVARQAGYLPLRRSRVVVELDR
ncbi:MAG: LPS export ABC transporter permease LptF [Nevskiaceae bacterium]|nr:MAG: LPS export ABC transporter permease LptF [Nevskiaceae bacterium]TBR74190.1 MAG: LPS export ABC transporter permease LptF [Nevskiaceae bacterium]